MSLREVFREGLTEEQVTQRANIVLQDAETNKKTADRLRREGIRSIFESCMGGAIHSHQLMECNPDAVNRLLQEAVSGPRLSAFTNITGKIVIDAAIEGFTYETNLTNQIFDTVPDSDDGGRLAALDEIDDDVLEVPEGHEYPSTDFGEKYEDTPFSVKRGLRIGLTREMVHFDKTSQLVQRAMSIGERAGVNKENRCMRTFLGIFNPWKPMGAETATYGSVAARNNLLTGTVLTDWTSVEAALLRFAQFTDDRGEPIEVTPTQLFVMPAKVMTANRILTATQIEEVTNNTTTVSANPIGNMGLSMLSSVRAYQLLQKTVVDPFTGNTYTGLTANNAANVWFLGNFKRTFKYREIFPMAVDSVGAEHPAFFERDIVAQYRVSERGTPYVTSPWHNLKITG